MRRKSRSSTESKIWYSLYGVSDRGQPQTYDEFVAYWDDMLDRFVPHKTVLYGTGYIRKGIPGPRRIPEPVWKFLSAPLNAYTRLVLVGTLPPQMREVCELEWDAKKEKRFQRFAAVMRALNPLINRLPVRALYASWAATAWAPRGCRPAGRHNRAGGVTKFPAAPPRPHRRHDTAQADRASWLAGSAMGHSATSAE